MDRRPAYLLGEYRLPEVWVDELGPQGPIWHREGRYDVGPELQHVAHYTGHVVAGNAGARDQSHRALGGTTLRQAILRSSAELL